ncbi:MAG: hypothetical protein V4555_00760 [Acidobacteriota bacterium]
MSDGQNTIDEVLNERTGRTRANMSELRTRARWKADGYVVPKAAVPAKVEAYLVPGYRTVYRDRHLFSAKQAQRVDAATTQKRQAAAAKAFETRIENMERSMETAQLTIVRGKSVAEIRDLALITHGGNYAGKPGEFIWSNRKARNTIRHCLTNYESLWAKINRGDTAQEAYAILRSRIDDLVDEAYPQFAEGMSDAECRTN